MANSGEVILNQLYKAGSRRRAGINLKKFNCIELLKSLSVQHQRTHSICFRHVFEARGLPLHRPIPNGLIKCSIRNFYIFTACGAFEVQGVVVRRLLGHSRLQSDVWARPPRLCSLCDGYRNT